MPELSENIRVVRGRISAAALKAGREPEDVLLLAVSKTVTVEDIRRAAEAGLVHFGENRVQEARSKIPLLEGRLVWHLVGHLQGNKARLCPDLFSWIHSVDSVPLAREIARRYLEKGRVCRCLIQVNVSGEDSKFGCPPRNVTDILSALIEEEGAEPVGLMTIPPFTEDPEGARPHFAELRSLRDDLLSRGFPAGSLRELSMGMSGDLEVAVEEGATIVRVGTALFGARV